MEIELDPELEGGSEEGSSSLIRKVSCTIIYCKTHFISVVDTLANFTFWKQTLKLNFAYLIE